MIETKRFIIRKFLRSDASMMFTNYVTNAEVTKYLTWYPHKTLDDTIKYLEFVLSTHQNNFAIVDKNNHQVIGSIANVSENADFTICEVGYCLGKNYWNQGIMTEVLTAYLDYLFNQRHYEMVTAKHHCENLQSGRVMIKAGFKYDGVSDELTEKFGWVNIYNYSINKEDYQMFKIISSISNKFKINIPRFTTIKQLTNYLETNGFLVKPITLINDKKFCITYQDNVCVIPTINENLITYYFIAKQVAYKQLYQIQNDFISKNQLSIFTYSELPIEYVLVQLLKKYQLTISFAESCTGGLMASKIINIAGASDIIKESYVTYSEEAKQKILGVRKETLNKFTVYSKEVAIEMAKGLKKNTNANICVSITGLAGSSVRNLNDGTYDACIIIDINRKVETISFRKVECGTRNSVRNKQANYIFYKIIKYLEKYN